MRPHPPFFGTRFHWIETRETACERITEPKNPCLFIWQLQKNSVIVNFTTDISPHAISFSFYVYCYVKTVWNNEMNLGTETYVHTLRHFNTLKPWPLYDIVILLIKGNCNINVRRKRKHFMRKHQVALPLCHYAEIKDLKRYEFISVIIFIIGFSSIRSQQQNTIMITA